MKVIRIIVKEIKELISIAWYFLICFGFILILLKLFLEEYSIEIYVISKAIAGAFVSAKAVMIVDGIMRKKNRFQENPRYVNILYKTFLYTLLAAIFGILEALIKASHKTKAISPGIDTQIHETNFSHFMAVILLLFIIFLGYNIYDAVKLSFGKGKIRKFFLSPPTNHEHSV